MLATTVEGIYEFITTSSAPGLGDGLRDGAGEGTEGTADDGDGEDACVLRGASMPQLQMREPAGDVAASRPDTPGRAACRSTPRAPMVGSEWGGLVVSSPG